MMETYITAYDWQWYFCYFGFKILTVVKERRRWRNLSSLQIFSVAESGSGLVHGFGENTVLPTSDSKTAQMRYVQENKKAKGKTNNQRDYLLLKRENKMELSNFHISS